MRGDLMTNQPCGCGQPVEAWDWIKQEPACMACLILSAVLRDMRKLLPYPAWMS